jgi:hypothetical protein
MKSPPVLIPPQEGKPFKLYIAAGDHTIGSTLMEEFEGQKSNLLFKQKVIGSRNKIFSY